MNGITLTVAAGGARKHSLTKRLMNAATRAAGRCLLYAHLGQRPRIKSLITYVDVRKVSSIRIKRGRYRT